MPCRSCRWCASGLIDHCEAPNRGGPIDGSSAVRIDSSVDIEQAAFVGLVARASRIAQFAAAGPSTLITLLGSDACTLLTAQLLARVAPRVRVLATDDCDLERCDRWGIRHRGLADAGLRGDQDVVVIGGFGSPDVFATAAGLVRPRARIIVTEASEFDAAAARTIVSREVIVAGIKGGSLHDAAALMATGGGPDCEGLGFEVRSGGGGGVARFGVVVKVPSAAL